jgi:hypothetical protein
VPLELIAAGRTDFPDPGQCGLPFASSNMFVTAEPPPREAATLTRTPGLPKSGVHLRMARAVEMRQSCHHFPKFVIDLGTSLDCSEFSDDRSCAKASYA